MLSVGPECDVFAPGTVFAVPPRKPGSRGPAPSALRTDSEPQSIAELVAGLHHDALQTVAFRDIDGQKLVSRFAFVRVIAAHPITRDRQAPREEWLIVEWPEAATSRPTTGSAICRPTPNPSASRASPGCPG